MAGATASGTTLRCLALLAREPEISDLAAVTQPQPWERVLGADVRSSSGGVDELRAVEHTVIPTGSRVVAFPVAAVAVAGEGDPARRRRIASSLLIGKMGPDGSADLPRADGSVGDVVGPCPGRSTWRRAVPGIAADYLPMLVAVMCLAGPG